MVTFGIFLIRSEARAVVERRDIRQAIEVALRKADARDDAKREELRAEITRLIADGEARGKAEREAILAEFRESFRLLHEELPPWEARPAPEWRQR
jgi:hypothetical protein